MRWKGSGRGGGELFAAERRDSRWAPDCVAVNPAWFLFTSNVRCVSFFFHLALCEAE